MSGTSQVLAQCPEQPSDSAFVALPLGNHIHATSGTAPSTSDALKYPIDRVVGPGTAAEFDGQGFLVNWEAYKNNGVVSEFAWLDIKNILEVDSADFSHDHLTVWVNGHANQPIELTGFNGLGSWGKCIKINTQYLKFARRADTGESPVPVTNDIALTIDRSEQDLQAVGLNSTPGTLSFQAMAPIVLVHGWNSGPWVWGPKPAVPSTCPADPSNAANGGQNFVQALIDAKVPYDCTTTIRPQLSSVDGGTTLKSELDRVLAAFGTKHVNLIAHSKGGLWARKFLQDNASADAPIGVISATTLDTPHHGSVLADQVVRFTSSRVGGAVDAFLRLIRREPGFIGAGVNDMTIAEVNVFNDGYLQPPPQFRLIDQSGNVSVVTPFYYSTSADADKNGDGAITSPEAVPYSTVFANLTYQIVARNRTFSLFRLLGLLRANTNSVADAKKNDTLVTIDSARYLRFSEINSYVGLDGRNHATIESPDVGQLVLLKIRTAESRQTAP